MNYSYDEWRPVNGNYQYRVNRDGVVRSSQSNRGRPANITLVDNMAVIQLLDLTGRRVPYSLARIVAEAWLSPPRGPYVIQNLDGDPMNCSVDNLRIEAQEPEYNLEEEVWAPVVGFEMYMVSTHGYIRHVDRVKPRRVSLSDKGFPVVVLFKKDSKTRYVRHINQLVATAFLPPDRVRTDGYHGETSYDHVWHIDGDLRNCHVANLLWADRTSVTEWNRMNREMTPAFQTPPVKNNRTGMIYANAFACAIKEGELESKILWRIERQAADMYDDNARYRYI